jgi:GNAT superfamily N-acetyltransferase
LAPVAAGPPHVAPYRREERAAATGLLARAFRDNPLNRAVVHRGASARVRANRHGMRAHLPPAERAGTLLGARLAPEAPLAGVLVAAAPGQWPFPPPPVAARLRCALLQGPGVARRWARVAEALREAQPVAQRFYLATLGVEPSLWGRGVGGALLAAWLAQVDARGGRAYLETDAPRNLRFYERAGFRVAREMRILGVPVWGMERPAGAPPAKEP